MSDWDEFVRWAKRFADVVDLDANERAYKVELAERLAGVRDQVLGEMPGWERAFHAALRSTNLLDWRTPGRLATAMEADRDQIHRALTAFWEGDPDPSRLDALVADLRKVASDLYPGSLTAVGSLLLMARQPDRFPPFRAEATQKWARLVSAGKVPSQPSERYAALINLCDALISHGADAGLEIRDRLEAQGLGWTVVNYPLPDEWLAEDRSAFAAWRGDPSPADLEVVERGFGPAPEAEAAAWRVLGAGLRNEPSPIDVNLTAWTADNARDLRRRISENPDTGPGSFLGKLHGQLSGAPPAAVLLAAELLYVHAAPLSNLAPETKVERVDTVLGWLPSSVALPDPLRAGLAAQGAFHGGVGFNIQIWQQLSWLCDFVAHWTSQPHEVRARALADPWAFRDIAASAPTDWPSMRYSLSYLAWPGTFPNLVSPDHRRRIRNAFADRVGGASGADDASIERDLVGIRQALEADTGGQVDFYLPPYAPMWMHDQDEGQRAWLVRPGTAGSDLVQRWVREEFVSLAGSHLGHVPPGSPLRDVQTAVERGYQHQDYHQRLVLAREYHSFLSVVKADDVVVTVADDQVHLGVVAGDVEYVGESEARVRRPVAWRGATLPREALPVPTPALLEQPGALVDLTAALEVLLPHVAGETANGRPVEEVPQLRSATDDLAQRLHMDLSDIQEMLDLLQARQQMVLYGPPGTGKTYLARQLAHHIVGGDDPSRVRLVQFHPSYSYEDFFEGFRPTETASGQATFKVEPGPLRLLASEAARPESAGEPFVLVIDEMNRTNLAKVFGELYFLLEYRKESVRLQYQPTEAFRLSPNVFIIGTMNTSDRSIALVDAAIRRRFPFVELHPDEPPVRGVLARYVERRELADDRRAHLLQALNDAIDPIDRDLRIGPSYLMREEADTDAGLRRIWRYDVLPLLEEHYYGRLSRADIHDRFGLDALLSGSAEGPAVDEPSDTNADDSADEAEGQP